MVFLPGLPGAFLFDDIPNLVNNTTIQLHELNGAAVLEVLAAEQPSGSMRGLPTLTFALDYWRAGGMTDPATFKTTNILIHALTACALAWLFRSLLLIVGTPVRRAAWLGPALALAWAAHPLQVSAVLYAVQRLQTMGTLFLVLALIAYVHARQAQAEGRTGRAGLLCTLLAWAAAMGCKEDSILLPAYTLALELTVLGFAAADTRLAIMLRRGYLLAALAAIALYALVVVPHYWTWQSYPGRNFSTPERLLTEARVLCLYLWQILLPLPGHMPFYYDWLQPSRSLLHPWTTLPAIGLIACLLALAVRMRHRLPLFSLGVFLFFGAHLIASNVVGLELAFEHRNHFALIGAVLAAGSLLAATGRRLDIRPALQTALVAALLATLAGVTLLRAHDWRSRVSLAQAGTAAAPRSPRAWIDLCDAYFVAGGGPVAGPRNPFLDDAIQACTSGVAATPDTLNSPALLIVLKTIRGDASPQDWERFQHRLDTVRMSWDNTRAPLILTYYAGLGVKLDKRRTLEALDTLVRRVDNLKPSTLATIGISVMNDLEEPDLAIPYFMQAVEAAPPGDPFPWQLGDEFRSMGRPDLANIVEQAGQHRLDAATMANRPAD